MPNLMVSDGGGGVPYNTYSMGNVLNGVAPLSKNILFVKYIYNYEDFTPDANKEELNSIIENMVRISEKHETSLLTLLGETENTDGLVSVLRKTLQGTNLILFSESEKYGDAGLYYDYVKTLQDNLEEAKLVLDVWKNKGNSFSGEVETYNQKLHDMKYRYAMAEMERVANAYNDYISNINIGEEGYNQYIESYPKDRILFEEILKNTYYPGTSLNVYSTLPYAYNRNIIW